jgi:pyruvate dehydrogenase E1 component
VFQIDAESIVVSVLQSLAQQELVEQSVVQDAFARLRIDDPTATQGVAQEGGDA